jgi:hypothetical protein
MFINNVGSMSQALYAYKTQDYDDIHAAKWQTVQVSTISVTSWAGRIILGAPFISDKKQSLTADYRYDV